MLLSPAGREARQLRQRFPDDQLVYFRLKPNDAAILAMDAVRIAHGLPRKFLRERFHITLLPLGDIRLISAEAMRRIRLAAESLEAEPFPLAFHRLDGNCLRGRNMHAAKEFQRTLVRRLEAFGVVVPDYDFDPHVTLSYTEWQQRNVPIDSIAWTASEFLLVNSIHGKGPELLDSWALKARQGVLAL